MQVIASILNSAVFLKSAPTLAQCPPEQSYEVAFAGRSNSGKSSAINTLTNQKKLARTSKTPGRTQLINFFVMNDDTKLVDLPGYGYAQVPEAVKQKWQAHMSEYLEKRGCLQGLILVMDIRHPLKPFDVMMLEWSSHNQMPVHILLSKADKLKKGPAKNTLLKVQKEIKAYGTHTSAQMFSSLKRTGVEQAHEVLGQWLGLNDNETAEDATGD